jgi:Ca2+-binding EF-hand superfamily protein
LKVLRAQMKDPSNSEYLTSCFKLIDKDGSGALDKEEFRVFLNFLLTHPEGFQQQSNHSLLKEELSKVARIIDDNTYDIVFKQVDLNGVCLSFIHIFSYLLIYSHLFIYIHLLAS